MSIILTRRPSQAVSTAGTDMEVDEPATGFYSLLYDPDTEPCLRPDSEGGSLRSHLSHPEQTSPVPSGPKKLHRRRNQYHYFNGTIIPESSSPSHQRPSGVSRSKSTRAGPGPGNHQQQQEDSHRRSKSSTLSGGHSSWLMSSAFTDARRQPWTGEKREIRKLQKEHPSGSARPNFSLEIGDGNGSADAGDGSGIERDGGKGSGLGVRRRIEKLRELYRKDEK